jgi:hypothetical protein
LVLFGFSKDRSAVDVIGNESQSGDKDAFSAFSTAKTRIIYGISKRFAKKVQPRR